MEVPIPFLGPNSVIRGLFMGELVAFVFDPKIEFSTFHLPK
jgi:hypothetical protein